MTFGCDPYHLEHFSEALITSRDEPQDFHRRREGEEDGDRSRPDFPTDTQRLNAPTAPRKETVQRKKENMLNRRFMRKQVKMKFEIIFRGKV